MPVDMGLVCGNCLGWDPSPLPLPLLLESTAWPSSAETIAVRSHACPKHKQKSQKCLEFLLTVKEQMQSPFVAAQLQ